MCSHGLVCGVDGLSDSGSKCFPSYSIDELSQIFLLQSNIIYMNQRQERIDRQLKLPDGAEGGGTVP